MSGDLPELAALFAWSLAPPAPRDRTAFFVGLAQGAYAGIVRRRGRQRPPSILARQEMLDAEERDRRLAREREVVRRGGGNRRGTITTPPPDPRAQARSAQEQRRREADFLASMEAGRVASARVCSSGILFQLRELPPALPAHGGTA